MKRAILVMLLAAGAFGEAYAEEGWTFSLTPYIWLPNINGTLKYAIPPGGGARPEVDTGPNDYLENLSFALMLAGEARKGRWSMFTDLIYLDFDSEASAVKAVDFGGQRIDTTLNASTRTSFSGPQGQTFAQSGSISQKEDLLDVIVGIRGRLKLGDGSWFLPYYADLGAGSSALTAQAFAGVGYAFKWGEMIATYRYVYYDLNGDGLLQDVRFAGPAVGATFRF